MNPRIEYTKQTGKVVTIENLDTTPTVILDYAHWLEDRINRTCYGCRSWSNNHTGQYFESPKTGCNTPAKCQCEQWTAL